MPFDDKRRDARIQARFMNVAGVAGVLTLFIAVSVLILNALSLARWDGISSDVVAMRPNTALCLLASGLSLWLLVSRRRSRWLRRLGYAAAAFAALLGAFTLLVLVFRSHSGVNHLLSGGGGLAAQFSPANQMGLNTAFCILAIGVALLLIDLKGAAHGWAIQLPAIAVWLISLAAIIGYLDDVRGLHAIQTYSDMSVLTSVTLFVLSTGVLFARPGFGFIRHMAEGNAGSILLRRMLPLTVIIPLAIGWFRLNGEKAGWYSLDGSAVVFTVVGMIFFIIFILLAIAPLNAMLREVRGISDKVIEEKATLAGILEGADHSIISVGIDGVITTFNRAAQRWLGYSAEEMVGKRSLMVLHDEQEVAEHARQLSLELQRTIEPGFEVMVAKARLGLAVEQQWSYIRKDGSYFPVSQTVTALRNAEGGIVGFLAIASDITQRLEVDRMKSEFISTVSHELRTPLTSIRGALALLEGGVTKSAESDDATGEEQSLIHIAYNNSERLIRLVNDILDVEKIAVGKLAFNFKPLLLDSCLEEALAANREYARQHDVELALHNSLPESWVSVDAGRFAQVMANLLSNACKFAPAGSTVEVLVDNGPLGVRVSVADRGSGIPEDFQSRIFERFAQADSSDHRRTGGTGLGLNICKAIVERMGGSIGYASRPGGGSLFYFDLPLVQATGAEIEDEAATGSPRILVCDGKHGTAKQLADILIAGGFRVDLASDAESARHKLSTKSYAALVTDILLAGADGLSFLKELRSRPETVGLPVIVISMTFGKGREEALRGGMLAPLDWLKPPIDPDALLKLLHDSLHFGGRQDVRILHVEDDADLRAVVRSTLTPEAQVVSAANIREARRLLEKETFDLVILDLMLPDGSGDQLIDIETLSLAQVPVLVFSAYEPGPALAARVDGVLAKARTTNTELVHTVQRLLYRHQEQMRRKGSN